MGRNRSVRALMRQTKWWAGFLDWAGVGNFVGPEEVIQKMGQDQFESKLSQYQNTPEAQEYFQESVGNEGEGSQPSQDSSSQTSSTTQSSESNPISDFFGSLFGNQVAKSAVVAIP